MRGAYPTACNHKIVVVDHALARLDSWQADASAFLFSAVKVQNSDVHFVFFIGNHLDSLPAMIATLQYPRDKEQNAGYYVQIDTIFKAVAREIIRVAFKRLAVQNLVSFVK
jgi:hypothetical protein